MYDCLCPGAVGINLPLKETFALAQSAGFAGVEFAVSTEQPAAYYQDLLAAHELRPAGHGLIDGWRATSDAEFAEAMTTLKAVAPLAKQIGITRFVTWILSFSDELNYRDNFNWHQSRLATAARILDDHGCTLGLEFLGPKTLRDGHRYPFARTIEQMLELCQAVGNNSGLLLDSWHWHTSLGTLEDIRALSQKDIQYIHVNDAPSGIPIEQQIDNRRCLPATTGVIDIAGFLDAVAGTGYDGPLVAEPFDDELRKQAPETIANRVAAAMATMRERTAHQQVPTMMKAISTGNRKAWLVDLPVPRPEGNQVIVKVESSFICGSNMHGYTDCEDCVNGGHEGAGEVVAVAHSTRVKVGDRVALTPCNACGTCRRCSEGDVIHCENRPQFHGNFAEYTRIGDIMCIPLPDDISYEHGALLGCGLGPAYGALKTLGVRPFTSVVIMGLGPVGLGATALATFMNARVIAIDLEPYRRQVAEQLGAYAVVDGGAPDFTEQLNAALGNDGLLRAVDCTGNGKAQRLLLDHAQPMAQIAFVGENPNTINVSPSNDFIRKHLQVTGVWHMNRNDTDDLIDFLRRAPNKADQLITHRFPMSQADEAFAVFASRQAVKVAFTPG